MTIDLDFRFQTAAPHQHQHQHHQYNVIDVIDHNNNNINNTNHNHNKIMATTSSSRRFGRSLSSNSTDFNRQLSTLEASNNENNKAQIIGSFSSSSQQPSRGRSPSPSVLANIGGGSQFMNSLNNNGNGGKGSSNHPSYQHPHRSESVGRSERGRTKSIPHQNDEQPLPRRSTSTSAARKSSVQDDTNASDNDNVIIEEKRRRLNGSSSGDGSNNGYTLHRYLRGRLLGRGGFAKVYLCTALDTGKNYAVKIVPKANLVKARARQKVCRTNNPN